MTRALRRVAALLRYALADMAHNGAATLAAAALFAVVSAPPLLLYAAKHGVLTAWTDELARDVVNREVVIARGRQDNRWLTPEEIRMIAAWPETGFVTPEASYSVRTNEWARLDAGAFRPSQSAFATLDMRTSRPGDPVFANAAAPRGLDEAAFSAAAAARMNLAAGDRAVIKVERMTGGRIEREFLEMTVVSVLEEARWPAANVFVAPELAYAIRVFQYGEGARDAFPTAVDPETVSWPTLRVYAPTIHLAPALRDRLRAFGFAETRLRADQIERLQRVEASVNGAFSLILGLSAAGFCATLFLVEWMTSARRTADLALLMVVGHTTRDVAIMRVAQASLTIGAGLGVALLAVAAAAPALDGLARAAAGAPQAGAAPWATLALASVPALLAGAVGATAATLRARRIDLAAVVRKD